MIKIRTVCGNGIGSSLMCAGVVRKICADHGIEAEVDSSTVSEAPGLKADLYITVSEIAKGFPKDLNVAIIRSYTNKKKVEEDVLDKIKELVE